MKLENSKAKAKAKADWVDFRQSGLPELLSTINASGRTPFNVETYEMVFSLSQVISRAYVMLISFSINAIWQGTVGLDWRAAARHPCSCIIHPPPSTNIIHIVGI